MTDYLLKNRNYILFALLLVLIYFPIFLHLTYMPIRMWDESITGVNAIEMASNHHYFVTYIDGHPDMYNCKPPLLLWCIVLSIKIFGFSKLALRLPSAIAALLLCIYLFCTIKNYSRSSVFAFLTVLILITCNGYVRNHVTRTGEYDSILTLFITMAAFSLFFATEATEKKQQSWHLVTFSIYMTLAVLTKGIAPLMFAPGFMAYVLIRKKIVAFLKNKWMYAGVAIFIVFGVGFYFLREAINPGYLKAVWINELGGRFSSVNEGHEADFSFYFNEIITWQFVHYMFIFPAALIIGTFFSDTVIKRLVLFAAAIGTMFLIVISIAATKLPHYDAPLFPFLAIIVSSFFYFIYTIASEHLRRIYQWSTASLIAFVFVLSFFIKPYSDAISRVYFPKGDWWEEGFSVSCKYFQHAVQGTVHEDNCKLIFDTESIGSGTVIRCYEQELKEHHINNPVIRHDEVKVHDKVIVFDPYLKQLISQKFVTEEVHSLLFCNGDVIYIKSEK